LDPGRILDRYRNEGEKMKSAQEIKRQAEALQAEYTDKEARLYRVDGQKRYSEAEHAEQIKVLRQERNQKLAALAEEANAAMQEASRESAAIKSEDLSGRLTADELANANANARHAFVSEDVAEMPSQAIEDRVDSVLAGGDRASMYLHARALRKRASQSDSPAMGTESAAKRLEDSLFGDSRKEGISAAEARESELMNAAMLASNLQQGARTAAGAWEARLGARRAG
jgi:hypothetical protein